MRFYEGEEFLLASLLDFLAPALEGDDAGVVIATPELHSRFDASLANRQVDAELLRREDRLVLLDAQELLDGVVEDAAADRERFLGAVEPVLERTAGPGRTVHVFGATTPVTSDETALDAALAVEELWNELAGRRVFRLLCAYPLGAFASDARSVTFDRLCDDHTAVFPAERCLPEDGARQGQAIAALQQRLTAAEAERQQWQIARRELQGRVEDLDVAGRSREQFVTTVVHDLRTPTTLVSTALGQLRTHLQDPDEDVEQLLGMALEGTERIERLVGDVLAAARVRTAAFTYDLRPVDLASIAERAARGVAVATGRRIDHVAPPGLPPAAADQDRQLQILDNLLWNAVKFSPEDSTVTVELQGSDDWLTVRVRDEGVGIAEEDQAGLFHPFARLRSGDVAGTGLGLSITKALVEGQGGTIRVESRPGAGAVFSYTVPVAR